MIGEPPSEGAVQLSATAASWAVPVSPVGAPGTAAAEGVTAGDWLESAPVPTPLIAATAKVYATPFVRPPTVKLVTA